VTVSRAILASLLVLAAFPPYADAQIYAWRDANGTLVLSDRKIDAPADVYEVAGAPTYRTTRPVASRSVHQRFEPLVQEYATRRSLRPELVRAVIQVESAFNPLATSPKGAMGLMQLMPQTARELGVRNAYDPEENIRGGTRYLRLLLDKYAGNEELALAAYNAGSGAVDKYGRQVPPYRETRDYVRKVGTAAGPAAAADPQTPKRRVYKTIEIVDGRVVPRYSTHPPESGTAEVVDVAGRR
jgi:soluble lytic murein transglycosylase-like protein